MFENLTDEMAIELASKLRPYLRLPKNQTAYIPPDLSPYALNDRYVPCSIMRTGEYFNNFSASGWGTFTLVANRVYTYILIVIRNITIDRIAINIQTAGGAGSKCRLGIYSDGVNFYPGALLVDGGEVAADSTGIKTVVVNQALTKGIYHLCVTSDGTPKLYTPDRCNNTVLGLSSGNLIDQYCGWTLVAAYGALATPFAAGATLSVSSAMPQIVARLLTLD